MRSVNRRPSIALKDLADLASTQQLLRDTSVLP